MVRAPCCEKVGLKKGPWTPEEDQILVSHIQRFGHANWRALPKQAGLLRCGKSCRLRWTNYLRPDIKRGNFSTEEEETIIKLHEMLGNRWSAIAARLPGRTDNEIKNVWHTHLKKRVSKPNQKPQSGPVTDQIGSKPITLQPNSIGFEPNPVIMQTNASTTNSSFENFSTSPVYSPSWSPSDISSSGSANVTNDQSFDSSSHGFLEIDESFWSEALSMENCIGENLSSNVSSSDDDRDFWLRVFMESGNLHDLPEL